MKARTALLAALVIASVAREARAIEPGMSNPGSADPPLPPLAPRDDLIDRGVPRTWDAGPVRPFVSTTLDVGWIYVRPRISAGYGRPFSSWIGVDANPVVSGQGIGAYGGMRLALPRFDLRVGTRFFGAFSRSYLDPKESYDRLDLTSTLNDPSQVVTHEAEIEFSLPLGPGDFIGLMSGSYVRNVPDGKYVFEEALRVVVSPPLVWRARGGYVLRFGSFRQHSLGVVADVLDVPKRDDSKTLRLGPVIRVVLSRRVEVRGAFVPTILSQDSLGLTGGDFTELGFRYRWATE
ncbi:MAG: hypothetical protein KF819_08920 [Labilithrix sp.]|nr:hypothetical protein [Labilithrix sp.]